MEKKEEKKVEEEKPEEKPVEPGVKEPEPPEVKPEKIPLVEQPREPLERDEFADMLDLFMGQTGIKDRRQAAALMAKSFRKMGVDPRDDMNKALKVAQEMKSLLEIFPDTPLASRTKDALMSTQMQKIAQSFGKTGQPDIDARISNVMNSVMPWIVASNMVGRMMPGGGDSDVTKAIADLKTALQQPQQGKTPEVEFLMREMSSIKDDLKAEKASKELEDRFKRLEDRIVESSKGKPEESIADKVTKAFGELKTTITEKHRDEALDEFRKGVEKQVNAINSNVTALQNAMTQGASQEDVFTQATGLLNSVGNFYKGFGSTAKALGYSPESEKLTGELRKDIMSLGKKALDVVDKGMKYKAAPPARKQVTPLARSGEPSQPSKPPIPISEEQPAEGTEITVEPPEVEVKPEEVPEAPPAAPFSKAGKEAPKKAEKPIEKPAEKPKAEKPPKAKEKPKPEPKKEVKGEKSAKAGEHPVSPKTTERPKGSKKG